MHSQDPIAGGKGDHCPLPNNPPPVVSPVDLRPLDLGFWPFGRNNPHCFFDKSNAGWEGDKNEQTYYKKT